MNDEEPTLRKFYADCLATFHTLDAKAVAAFYAPPVHFATENAVIALADLAAVEKTFAQIIVDLQSRSYDHSSVANLEVRILSAQLAQLGGDVVRYAKDGSVLERSGAAYTLRKTDGQWRFVAVVAYPIGA